jgi:hypothetical protein
MSARGAVKIMQTAKVEFFTIIEQWFMKLSAALGDKNFSIFCRARRLARNQ